MLRNRPPTQSTPFVGRSRELAEVVDRLRRADCRLLSLVGPGGIGKSRLALQAVQSLLDLELTSGLSVPLFAHGVCFVQLGAVSSASYVAPAIAEVAGLAFYDNSPPKQLLDYLSKKSMLLVLDNVEQMLKCVDLISEILSVAPGVKILSTTQATLNLHEEWFYRVDKLSYPEVDSGYPVNLEQFDALQLFVKCAQRALATFAFGREYQHVIQICRLVEGMPLAIEMAATWLKVMPCSKIAHAIAHDFDLLSTRWQNMPERQRSMRAVFQYSLQLLSVEAHAVLMRLSVFRGGFQPEAAERVAGASLQMLAQLAEKSLLYTTADGCFQMHGLLRQFCYETFQASDA